MTEQTTDDLRYGVIGTGMMGIEHINNLLHLPGATVTAVADPHAESLDWAQLAVGLDTPLATFSNHHDLLVRQGHYYDLYQSQFAAAIEEVAA